MGKAVPASWLEAAFSLTPNLACEQANGFPGQLPTSESIRFSQEEIALIKNAMGTHAKFVKDEALERLAQCHFTFARCRSFGAQAGYENGREVIVLYEGMFEVMVAVLGMSYAVSSLPKELDAVCPNPDYPEVSATGWAAVLFMRLIYGYAVREEPPPNFQALLGSRRDTEFHFGLVGGLWWNVLHELGHHVCGHVTARTPVTRIESESDLLVSEEITRYQRIEFEADRYSFLALTEEGKAMHMSWMNTALAAQMMFDSLLTLRKDTRPLSVNRLERLLSWNEYTIKMFGRKKMDAHLKHHAHHFIQTEQEHLCLRAMDIDPLIANLDRQTVETLIHSLVPTFEDYGIDIGNVLSTPEKDWRNYLQR